MRKLKGRGSYWLALDVDFFQEICRRKANRLRRRYGTSVEFWNNLYCEEISG